MFQVYIKTDSSKYGYIGEYHKGGIIIDTTPEYIAMCNKAEEIQSVWKLTGGDWMLIMGEVKVLSSKIIHTDRPNIRFAIPKRMTLTSPILDSSPDNALNTFIDYIDFEMCPLKYCIWLPRQDQLQELLSCEHKYFRFLLEQFYRFCFRSYYLSSKSASGVFESIEQLWLGYVMANRCNKYWNGSDWIAEQEER